MNRLSVSVMLVALLTACAPRSAVQLVSAQVVPAPPGWEALISAQDRDRLARLPATWATALAAISLRQRALVAKESDLLVAGAARSHPGLPPGSYRCRLVKLGADTPRGPAIRSFPDNYCYIRAEAGDALSFTKQTGSELPGGWLHADSDRRMILVGARQRAVGDNSLVYGAAPDRDLVGTVERVGPFRWRLVLPWRADVPGLDIYELTPIPLERQAVEPPAPAE
jgi:hypothetical protein